MNPKAIDTLNTLTEQLLPSVNSYVSDKPYTKYIECLIRQLIDDYIDNHYEDSLLYDIIMNYNDGQLSIIFDEQSLETARLKEENYLLDKPVNTVIIDE